MMAQNIKVHAIDYEGIDKGNPYAFTFCGRNANDWDKTNEEVTCPSCLKGTKLRGGRRGSAIQAPQPRFPAQSAGEAKPVSCVKKHSHDLAGGRRRRGKKRGEG